MLPRTVGRSSAVQGLIGRSTGGAANQGVAPMMRARPSSGRGSFDPVLGAANAFSQGETDLRQALRQMRLYGGNEPANIFKKQIMDG